MAKGSSVILAVIAGIFFSLLNQPRHALSEGGNSPFAKFIRRFFPPEKLETLSISFTVKDHNLSNAKEKPVECKSEIDPKKQIIVSVLNNGSECIVKSGDNHRTRDEKRSNIITLDTPEQDYYVVKEAMQYLFLDKRDASLKYTVAWLQWKTEVGSKILARELNKAVDSGVTPFAKRNDRWTMSFQMPNGVWKHCITRNPILDYGVSIRFPQKHTDFCEEKSTMDKEFDQNNVNWKQTAKEVACITFRSSDEEVELSDGRDISHNYEKRLLIQKTLQRNWDKYQKLISKGNDLKLKYNHKLNEDQKVAAKVVEGVNSTSRRKLNKLCQKHVELMLDYEYAKIGDENKKRQGRIGKALQTFRGVFQRKGGDMEAQQSNMEGEIARVKTEMGLLNEKMQKLRESFESTNVISLCPPEAGKCILLGKPYKQYPPEWYPPTLTSWQREHSTFVSGL